MSKLLETFKEIYDLPNGTELTIETKGSTETTKITIISHHQINLSKDIQKLGVSNFKAVFCLCSNNDGNDGKMIMSLTASTFDFHHKSNMTFYLNEEEQDNEEVKPACCGHPMKWVNMAFKCDHCWKVI